MRRARLVAAALCAGLSLVCTTPPPHPYVLAAGHDGAEDVRSVLLLPMNLLVQLPGELQRPAKGVSKRVAGYLRDCGKEVASLGLYDARELWGGAIPQSDPDEKLVSLHKAARRFAERLRDHRAFDAAVMPSLVYRQAQILQVTRDVIWDGVKRKLAVKGMPAMKGSIYLAGDFAGKMPAVSLHLYVFDAGGARVFESYGGLDLVHEADVTDSAETYSWQLRLKRQRLADDAAVDEGIRIAFTPYLLPSPEISAEGS